jgi:hypothetical protein
VSAGPTSDLVAGVTTARDQVETQRAKLAQVEAERAAAEAELESLEERSGPEVLADLDRVDDVAETIGKLRGRITMLGRAAEAQRPLVMVAESRYLAAEADALEPEAVALEAELAEHQAKTRRLLDALERHEGPYVAQITHVQTLASFDVEVTGLSWKEPKSAQCRAAATLARRRVTVLRELAAGRGPEHLIREWGASRAEVYPDCLKGRDALVPTPSYLRSVAAAHQTVTALETALEKLPGEIAELEAAADLHGFVAAYGSPDNPRYVIARQRQRFADLPAELEQARAHLAALQPAE